MKKIQIFVVLGVLIVGVPVISKLTDSGSGAEQVDVHTVERKPIKSSILASGTLTYRDQVQLGSEVIAQVTAVLVEEGDSVSKGDLLVALDTESFDAQVEQAEARVRIADIAIDRQALMVENLARRYGNAEELVKSNLVDEDSVENLESELNMARVDLRSLEESVAQARAALAQSRDLLEKTQITSPIDGIVIQVDVKAGETVIAGTTNLPGSTLIVVADPTEKLVEVRVDEADIAQVREGQQTDIFAAAYPDTAMTGVVESIATTARQTLGQQSLSYLVKILLDEEQAVDFRSGMSARADIYTETSDKTLSVPIQAVRYEDALDADEDDAEAQSFVFVVDDGAATRHDVKTGISSDSDQEILEGIAEGDEVIIGPFRVLRDLQDGDSVESRSEPDEDSEDSED